MKYVLLFLLSVVLVTAQAQQVKHTTLYLQARRLFEDRKVAQAFPLFMQSAQNGDAEAMNALGLLYSKGEGVAMDEAAGLRWFIKAGESGYARAWFNAGTMYKNGTGTQQNFDQAYRYFSRGAAANDLFSGYGKGYMLYKGLGCTQNYREAFELFSLAARMKSKAAMYMLGLCYRNGYGTGVQADSAAFWLKKAAALGYRHAADELASNTPENTQQDVQKPAVPIQAAQAVVAGDLTGTYTGYVVRYDWSGEKVLAMNPVQLMLTAEQGYLKGVWKEGEQLTAGLQATVSGQSVLFDNSGYEQKDHYNQKRPGSYGFRQAALNKITTADSVFLAGNVQLWSNSMNEPEKPVFISLTKVKAAITATTDNRDGARRRLVAYPNPFDQFFRLQFTLERKSVCVVSLLDINGRTLYTGKPETLDAGIHDKKIEVKVPAGTYMARLIVNNQNYSTPVIKQ